MWICTGGRKQMYVTSYTTTTTEMNFCRAQNSASAFKPSLHLPTPYDVFELSFAAAEITNTILLYNCDLLVVDNQNQL